MKTYGLKYLDGFSCIGPDCEDDCCTGWAVPVDEPHYQLMAARLGASEEGAAELARTIVVEEEPTRQRHALMVLDDRKRCSQLGEDRLCRLHARFGEEVLSDTCAVFPRSSGVIGQRFEAWASLSCPEIARRCLLSPSGTEPYQILDGKLMRGLIYRAARGDEDLYHASFDAVRSLVLGLLAQRQMPVASRLFAIAWFADQTRVWLRHDATHVDRDAMAQLFALLQDGGALAQLDEQFRAVPATEPFGATVVQQVLLATRQDPSPVFARLADAALALDGEDDPVRLWTAHRARTAALPAITVEKLELALEQFCRNFAFKDWYILMASFTRWLQGLLVRQIIVRYLSAAHPLAHEAPERAIVEVAYSLSRTLEHDERSMSRILDALESQGMQTISHAVALLKF